MIGMKASKSEVFPANAGMIPSLIIAPLTAVSVPRECGDDP